MGRIRFISHIDKWVGNEDQRLDKAMLTLATDIDRVAKLQAPQETGALRASGIVKRNGLGKYSVIFGGGDVRYARKRHFENRKNPQTLRNLERAGDNQVRNAKRYFKGN